MGEPCGEKERLLRDTLAGLLELVRILELMIAYSRTGNTEKFKELEQAAERARLVASAVWDAYRRHREEHGC
jgi:hypothetical protein